MPEAVAGIPFQLRDAIFSYYRVFDVNIKVWSFYWIVAIGILGFLWSTRREPKLKMIMMLLFAVFAMGNLLVVTLTQGVLQSINVDVLNYLEANEVEGRAFDGSLKQLVGALPMWVVAAVHIVADIGILAALWFAKVEDSDGGSVVESS